jgi:hypothetical protein
MNNNSLKLKLDRYRFDQNRDETNGLSAKLGVVDKSGRSCLVDSVQLAENDQKKINYHRCIPLPQQNHYFSHRLNNNQGGMFQNQLYQNTNSKQEIERKRIGLSRSVTSAIMSRSKQIEFENNEKENIPRKDNEINIQYPIPSGWIKSLHSSNGTNRKDMQIIKSIKIQNSALKILTKNKNSKNIVKRSTDIEEDELVDILPQTQLYPMSDSMAMPNNESGRCNPAMPTFDIMNRPPDFDLFNDSDSARIVFRPIQR